MKSTAMTIILVVGVLLSGEIAARKWASIDLEKPASSLDASHPYLRFERLPDFQESYIVDGIPGLQGTTQFHTNMFGFRSSSMKTQEKKDQAFRIFFLGGSTTEQVVLPEKKTFSYLVEKKLKEWNPKILYESVNAGISGYTASDILAQLIYKVLYYEPDFIVVMQTINDVRYGFVPDYNPLRHSQRRKQNDRGEQGSFFMVLHKVLRQSHLLYFLKKNVLDTFIRKENQMPFKQALRNHVNKRKQMKTVEGGTSQAFNEYLKSMEKMIFIAKGRRIPIVFMTEPSVYGLSEQEGVMDTLWMGIMPEAKIAIGHETLQREMLRFNEGLRRLASSYEVPLIDLEPVISLSAKNFYDDVHLTPQGAEAVAEIVFDELKPLLSLSETKGA